MDRQDSYGCRECASGHNLLAFARPSLRCGRGRTLLGGIGPLPAPLHLIMDRAYEDNETRQLALDFSFNPVVPPKSNRLEPWQYDKAMYCKRNEIERLFRRLQGFRRIFSL
jgi:transposase